MPERARTDPWEPWRSNPPGPPGPEPRNPGDFAFRGLSLHGFWLGNWIRNAPRAEIQGIYQTLGGLVADGSLSAAVEQVYPIEQFKQAFERSLKSNRSGKILFNFGAH